MIREIAVFMLVLSPPFMRYEREIVSKSIK